MQKINQCDFSTTDYRTTFSIAGIFILRMLGLFMVVPIFSLYAQQLENTTPFLLGIALGCYGLTQALFQMPFGMISDRLGRKPIIAIGLALFALGSVICALTHSIEGMIAGRSLQGAGAVGGTTLALLADLTPAAKRTLSMTIVGISIGVSFSLAMLLGPLLNIWIHVSGIFWLSFLFAILGIAILIYLIPHARVEINPAVEVIPADFKSILFNMNLMRLNVGILLLHAFFTALFVALPILLYHSIKLENHQSWSVYFPALILALLCVFPLIRVAEKKQKTALFFRVGIILLMLTPLLIFFFQHSFLGVILSLGIFFTAFTLLEGMLPSTVSKIAPPDRKGTALGIFSTSQFLGIFIGGTLGGFLLSIAGISGVLWGCSVMGLIWLAIVVIPAKAGIS